MVLGVRFNLCFVFFISLNYTGYSRNFSLGCNKTINTKMSNDLEKVNNSFYAIENKTILHTSPHPDDVTLGYLPYINWLLDNYKNEHYFITITSGSNAVRNSDLINLLSSVEDNFLKNEKNTPLENYILKNIPNIMGVTSEKLSLLSKIYNLKKDLESEVDNLDLKKLKGAIREFEEESVWKSFGICVENIIHFKADFYFNISKLNDDIERFYTLLIKVNPDVISLTVDPKGIGPETHYKTFLVVQAAVKRFYEVTKKEILVIGYRNVWHQFELNEANLFFPVTKNDFKILNDTFLNCYKTQVDAMFPNSTYKRNFAEIAIEIMKVNLKKVDFNDFYDKNIQGFCLLKKMNIHEFLNFSL